MIIDPTINLKNLAGEVLKDGTEEVTLGKALGGLVLNSSEGGKMKIFVLAQKIYSAIVPFDLDASDYALVMSCVKNSKTSPAIISGQIELLLGESK